MSRMRRKLRFQKKLLVFELSYLISCQDDQLSILLFRQYGEEEKRNYSIGVQRNWANLGM